MFLSCLALLKQKTFKVHSDKIQFSVVDLTHIDLAAEEKSARQVREAWDDFFRVQRSVQSQLEHQQTIISSQEAELEALKIQLHEKDALIAELQAQNDALKARLK